MDRNQTKAINIDFLKTCGNNLKRLASSFQVAIHFHPSPAAKRQILAVRKSVEIHEKAPLMRIRSFEVLFTKTEKTFLKCSLAGSKRPLSVL